MSEIKSAGIPQMSIGGLTKKLSVAYCKMINDNVPFKTFPSVMLWGAPGVGKSQAVRQIATTIEQETGKKCNVVDVRLLLFNPIDLRGIPTANADKTLAVWLKPQIFQMDESQKVVNILFLDEISAAPQSVQAAAYQITLDRVVGEHKLPDNCIVIAAGNRVTDKSVAFKMPKALANRLMHIEVEVNFDSWRKWAVEKGVNEKVIGFLSFRKQFLLNFDSSQDDLAFATPRSWEAVSNILNFIGGSISQNFALICGLVGTGVATEFRSWERVYADLPSIEDIFEGKYVPVPKETDVLYALVSSMTRYAKEHKKDLRQIDNSICYADRLPADFSVVLLKDYLSIGDDFREQLMTLASFQKWLREKGRLINGNI